MTHVATERVLTLFECNGQYRKSEFIQIGLPLCNGQFDDIKQIHLSINGKTPIKAVIKATTYWPDQSIKWCLLKFNIDINANDSIEIHLSNNPALKDLPSLLAPVSETQRKIIINTKNAEFQIDKEILGLLGNVTFENKTILLQTPIELLSDLGGKFESSVTDYQITTQYHQNKPIAVELEITGNLQNSGCNETILVNINYIFTIDTDTVKYTVTIHNPKAATHKRGQWDLGDPNSVYFSNFDLIQKYSGTPIESHLRTVDTKQWQTSSENTISIYQESSGGLNWASPNHKNRFNKVPLQQKGYRLELNEKIVDGERASPTLSIQLGINQFINIKVKNFWQNFPKALTQKPDLFTIGLFPQQFPDLHELQPGEKKTHEIHFSLTNIIDEMNWVDTPIQIVLSPEWIDKTDVIPNFTHQNIDCGLQKIISQGITGPSNFFIKREEIDEYGWRNFGDIYADHEAAGAHLNEPFSSHYNNQYDPLGGFLQQYLRTGENQWLELANDLAKHTIDIDIYHTNEDKDEYNNGLFWHTDHYVPAETASHRTYSKSQPKNAYQDHSSGGGPGGQHCYTTGLAYHYLLTGNEASKQSVFKLTNWIESYYEGNGTVAHFLLALKNSNDPGIKNVKTGQYPLDRGTGNYITALLDSYLLSGKQSLLDQAGLIVKNTVHPQEKINERNLTDVENRWFYTVFLQSLIRFLDTKESVMQIDSSYFYARDTLVNYADWMLENEHPYLEKPEILEFPNTTWAAQDLRKALIFKAAVKYNKGMAKQYKDKANFFLTNTIKTLMNDESSSYTRILSLLMQNNLSPVELNEKVSNATQVVSPFNQKKNGKTPSLLESFIESTKGTSLFAEVDWLKKRTSTRYRQNLQGRK
jgi:hypothetical protein